MKDSSLLENGIGWISTCLRPTLELITPRYILGRWNSKRHHCATIGCLPFIRGDLYRCLAVFRCVLTLSVSCVYMYRFYPLLPAVASWPQIQNTKTPVKNIVLRNMFEFAYTSSSLWRDGIEPITSMTGHIMMSLHHSSCWHQVPESNWNRIWDGM